MKKIYFLFQFVFTFYSFTAFSQLTGINPNQAVIGTQNLMTTISSNGIFIVNATQWGNLYNVILMQGTTTIPVFNTSAGNATVLTTDSCRINYFNIPMNVPTGLYDLTVKTQNNSGPILTYTLPSSFTVLPPDGYIQGNVYEDLNLNKLHDGNEYGLNGVRIILQPGGQLYFTDVNGNYSIPALNGTYTVSCVVGYYVDPLYLTTDSISFTVNLNNANVTGLDFGMRRELKQLAPSQSIGGRTVNFTLTSRGLFTPPGTGNIDFIEVQSKTSGWYCYGNTIQIIDSNTVTFSANFPVNAPLGLYYIRALINSATYQYLYDCFTILPYDAFLQGKIFFDVNGNGVLDTLEPGLPNERVNIVPDSGACFSSQFGDYSFDVLNGIHTVAWSPSPSSIFQLSSDSASYTVNNTGTMNGLNFGLSTTNLDYSCHVDLTASSSRCNSNVYYFIRYEDQSNILINGTIYFIKDSSTTYISSTIAPSGMNGDSIFWNYTNLQPFSPNYIRIQLAIPGSGVIQSNAGMISVDGFGLEQIRSVSSITQTISCSYDPNDKTVIPEGSGPEHFTLMNDWLEYLVRFQNTGTDTAFDVTIYDHLGNDLDLNTFELLGSSHAVTTEIKHNGEAIFTFAHIMLPDSNVDEPNSHGFMKYRIKMKPNVSDFTTVENTAFIVFDQNSPVVTNTTSNLMVTSLPVGLFETVKSTGQAMIYPNPFSETALLIFNNENHSSIRFELRDVLGKLVRTDKSNGEEIIIRRNNLSTGVYFYRLINPDGKINSTGKMVIR